MALAVDPPSFWAVSNLHGWDRAYIYKIFLISRADLFENNMMQDTDDVFRETSHVTNVLALD